MPLITRSHTPYICSSAPLVSAALDTNSAASSSAPSSTWAVGAKRLVGDRPVGHGLRQHRLDDAEAVLHPDLAPALPAEHRRGVDQDDALHVGSRALLEEQPSADAHRGQLVGGFGGHDAGC